MGKLTSAIAASAVGIAALVIGFGHDLRAVQEPPLAPAIIASPAPPTSAQPQLTVSDRGILLSWIERTGTHAALKFAERTSTGWTEPRQVAAGSDWFVNWADVPSVIRLADGSIYGHWLQKSGAATYAYDVRLARSTDDGKTFSASFTPHQDGTKREHGFASLFQMPGAGLGLVWLDGRAMKSAEGGGGHDSAGDMSVRSAIYDRAGKQLAEQSIDARVCECCPTALAVTADGPIVAYRDRSAEEVRDIALSRLVGGKWSPPVAVHADNWKIAACPVNGPALSADGRNVALAWFTAVDDKPAAYLAFSTDSGATFGSPIRLDVGIAVGRVDVDLLSDGSALASWIEFTAAGGQFTARRVRPTGEKSLTFAVAGLTTSRASGYPRLARYGDEVIFAWTGDADAPGVRTAALRIPSRR